MAERDMVARPYTSDEMRAVEYILEISKGQIGGGDDPIGFLIASHRWLTFGMNEAQMALAAERLKFNR